MKSFSMACVCLFAILFSAPPVKAEIVWEGDYYTFRYAVENNGGEFYHFPSSYLVSSSNTEILYSGSGALYSGTASGNLSEFPDPVPGEIRMQAMAKGPEAGTSPVLGLTVQGYAQIVPSGFDEHHGINVTQKVVSWVTRRFHVSGDGTYRFDVDLIGAVDFNDFGSGGSYQGVHSFAQTRVELMETTDNWGSVHAVQGFPLYVDEGTRERTADATLSASAKYELKVVLIIEARLANYILGGGVTGELPAGDYRIGEPAAPMVLSAIVYDPSVDLDEDDVPDAVDNCPNVFNPDQADADGDNVGNACDNCPFTFNSDQADADGDGIGDQCDLSLSDAIAALQILAGLTPALGNGPADISGDQKVGFEEVIYALQNASGLR